MALLCALDTKTNKLLNFQFMSYFNTLLGKNQGDQFGIRELLCELLGPRAGWSGSDTPSDDLGSERLVHRHFNQPRNSPRSHSKSR